MAINVVSAKKKDYVGLSTDAKPATAPTGSTFLETNTGKIFIYDGQNWVVLGG